MAYIDKLLAKDEFVILSAHRHPLFMIVHALPMILAAIGFWILAILALLYSPVLSTLLAIVFLVLSFFPIAIAAYRFLYWRMEQYIITTYRIIQIEGLVNRKTFDSALEMVNDVVMNQPMIGRLFDYGSINIITGSDIGLNELTGIAKPFEFKRALVEAKIAFTDDRADRGSMNLEFDPRSGDQDLHNQATSRLETPKAQQSDPSRVVIALTELRNAGMLSESEFDEKMRAIMRE